MGAAQSHSCGCKHLPAVTVADEVAMRSALERYDDIDLNFANSREANFLKVHLLHASS